uniref:Serpentine receptor class gamma n=1 Tax=Globodera rostochiensis TaxID=31243 RepID=A0A914HQH8_GLORO
MALYIAEIVTIVRHKKFHNSFYALFVMRAIPDLLYVLDSFYGQRFPSIIGSLLYPIYSSFPNWMLAMFFFFAGHTFQANNLVTAFILLNRLTAIIMPIKHEKLWRKFLPFITIFVYFVPTLMLWPMFKIHAILILNAPNSTIDRSFFVFEAGDDHITGNNLDDIKKKLLFYALATFFGHALVVSMYLISVSTNIEDPKTKSLLYIYYPLIMDTGTVVLSSWLLLWASGTFRQQLIKDFTIIRKINIQNNRVDAMEGPRNNTHLTIGGAVGHQLHNRMCRSAQQLPAIS